MRLLKRLRKALAGVMEWSAVDKGQIPLLFLVPILLQYSLWGLYILNSPAHARFVQEPALQRLFEASGLFVTGGLLLMLLGVALRQRHADSPLFQHLAIQYYAAVLVYMGYQVGLTEISTGLVLLGAPVFGFIVLDRLAVWLGTATALLLFFALSLATLHGHLPYAPIMAPATDAAAQQFRFYSSIGFSAPHFILILLLADSSLNFWRRREDTIRRLSLTDALTGLANRRSILAQLEREVARTRRQGQPLCVVILDLDHFKKINDRWGHPTGDRVLQEAARVLGDCLRASDGVGRYGGEEFMLVLPDTDGAGAEVLLERCRAAIAATPVQSDDGVPFHISASFGVACTGGRPEASTTELIRLADEALYRAKEAGRNRIEMVA